jgi:hypothetical protein
MRGLHTADWRSRTATARLPGVLARTLPDAKAFAMRVLGRIILRSTGVYKTLVKWRQAFVAPENFVRSGAASLVPWECARKDSRTSSSWSLLALTNLSLSPSRYSGRCFRECHQRSEATADERPFNHARRSFAYDARPCCAVT